MAVIEIEGLRKEYRTWRGRRTLAVDGLDLSVEEGGVFGFLGPNGSGKTTTIRCLLGLSQPNSGTCRILGRDPQTDLADVIGRIGSIVEGPALFPNFSGRRNLELLAAVGGVDPARIDEVLGRVGLAARARDLVKTYSLGMRQRLAIAAALLKDPDILILDEPANGLDPAGIKDVRELLRSLGQEGRTVLVSSHILGEVQQTCDRVAILARGRCVAVGSVDEVLSSGRGDLLLVKIDDLSRAMRVLVDAGFVTTIRDGGLAIESSADDGAAVVKALADRGLYPHEVRLDAIDLETVFLALTDDDKEVAA